MTTQGLRWRIKTRKRNKRKPPGFPSSPKGCHPPADHPMLPYMNAHLEWMAVNGYSAATVQSRLGAIRRFVVWCDERGLKHPSDVSKQVVERYQRYLFYYRKQDGKPLTSGTQMGRLAPLKLWFRWLSKENHILYNPASELDIPRDGKRLPRVVLSVQEVEAIIAGAEANDPMSLRDRALLELLYSTGLRRMEASNLAVYDADFTRRLVIVREGKNKRDRVVPIGERALAWLDKYLLEGRPKLLTSDHAALFVTDYGEPTRPDLIATRVRKYMEHAGIDRPGATHLLRHACATHMLEGGADIRFLQVMLGHENLETTAIYTHVAIDKLQAIHAATHPARLHRQDTEAPAPSQEDREALLEALEADTAP